MAGLLRRIYDWLLGLFWYALFVVLAVYDAPGLASERVVLLRGLTDNRYGC